MRAAEAPSTPSPHNVCHFRDLIGSLEAIPSPPTESARRLRMEESVHDISDGLLAENDIFWKTYRLSESRAVRSSQHHS
jgi:hypothetical protein